MRFLGFTYQAFWITIHVFVTIIAHFNLAFPKPLQGFVQFCADVSLTEFVNIRVPPLFFMELWVFYTLLG